MSKIAQIGTFDYKNYGDLLFPLILNKELSKRLPNICIDLFSPIGGTMPFHKTTVHNINELQIEAKKNNYSAYVIGGGDLIRCDTQFAPLTEYNATNTLELWQTAYPIAQKTGAKILFNAPGVPFSFTKEQKDLVRSHMYRTDYISVRGVHSAQTLKDCNVYKPIYAVPDSGFLMRNLYTEEELNAAYAKLTAEQNLPENYILVQYNDYDGSSNLSILRATLKELSERLNCKVLLMPAGYVHLDQVFLERLNDENDFQIATGTLSPLEMMAIISHAKYSVASSFHVVITSLVFQVPTYPLHIAKTKKMQELCEMINAKESLCHQFSDILTNAPILLTSDQLNKVISEADAHMDRLATFIAPETFVRDKHTLNNFNSKQHINELTQELDDNKILNNFFKEKLEETELLLCETEIEHLNIKLALKQLSDEHQAEISQLKEENLTLNNQLYYISQSRFWKLRNLLRKIYDSIFHRDRIASADSSSSEVSDPFIQEELKDRSNLYEHNIDFSSFSTDIKPIALYLPQFHAIPENDEWWGEGFTEWTNVKKGTPRFTNHNQPRIPDEYLGYYDLTDIEVMKKQVALAKQHGIYAFAFYYYWFSGKRLLEKPIDMLLEHPEIDFPFFAIWANENWTRTWDGMANDVLLGQDYSDEDPVNFILDLKKYLDDPRYMRVDGKPVIGLYAPRQVPNLSNVIKLWRKTAQECGIGDILIWTCVSEGSAEDLGFDSLVDGQYEFPPRNKGHVRALTVPNHGTSYSYDELVEIERYFDIEHTKIPTYRGSMLEWDNSARKKTDYHCWDGYSPEKFYLWNCINVAYTRKHFEEDKRFIFVNAWNEWGEGTYLEPDTVYGYSAINALSKAIMDFPYDYDETAVAWQIPNHNEILYLGGVPKRLENGWDARLMESPRIAIQAHVFYPEVISDICSDLDNITFPYDLYVTTTADHKATYIRKYLEKHSNAQNFHIMVVENKGRDVYPFIQQMKPVITNYDYFCHIHSKKSLHGDMGSIWKNYLYENLLGSKEIVRQTLYLFEHLHDVGIIFAQNPPFISKFIEWGSNKPFAEWLMRRMNFDDSLPEHILFPAGNMFWGRVAALKDVFEISYLDTDFPEEAGQIDGTIMHAIERIWIPVADKNGYTYQLTRSVLDNCSLE